MITGTDLMSFAKDAEGSAPHPMLKGFTRRMSKDGAILVLVGQPGTGKKTLIKQAILGMNGDELENSALLFCGFSGSCKTLRADMDSLQYSGFRNVFILDSGDCEWLLTGSSVLKFYMELGMRIVITGPNAYRMHLIAEEALPLCCTVLRMNFVDYRIHCSVFGNQDVFEFITTGGLLYHDREEDEDDEVLTSFEGLRRALLYSQYNNAVAMSEAVIPNQFHLPIQYTGSRSEFQCVVGSVFDELALDTLEDAISVSVKPSSFFQKFNEMLGRFRVEKYGAVTDKESERLGRWALNLASDAKVLRDVERFNPQTGQLHSTHALAHPGARFSIAHEFLDEIFSSLSEQERVQMADVYDEILRMVYVVILGDNLVQDLSRSFNRDMFEQRVCRFESTGGGYVFRIRLHTRNLYFLLNLGRDRFLERRMYFELLNGSTFKPGVDRSFILHEGWYFVRDGIEYIDISGFMRFLDDYVEWIDDRSMQNNTRNKPDPDDVSFSGMFTPGKPLFPGSADIFSIRADVV